jgi:hypothetical protein
MTLHSSRGATPDSPPMKICTPCARLEISSSCSRPVLRSNSSNSFLRLAMLEERSCESRRLLSPEITTSSADSLAARLPASSAAVMSWVMSAVSCFSSSRMRRRISSKLSPA